MIRHVSIPARDPERVAEVLAELMRGQVYPFPGGAPGAFMAVAGDEHGSLVEVYQDTTVGVPGAGEAPAQFEANPEPPVHWPFHMLLSTPLEEAAIQAIGEREGWRTRRFGRGAPGRPPLFEVIEMWLENRFLVELSTPDMDPAYLRTYRSETLEGLRAHT